MVSGARGQSAVLRDGVVVSVWPSDVAGYLAGLAARGASQYEADGRRLRHDVVVALHDLAFAVKVSRQAPRSDVTADLQLLDADADPRSSLPQRTVTVQEAADMLHVSESTVLRRLKRYGAEKRGRQYALDAACVEADVRESA